jgi:hypothetical protein
LEHARKLAPLGLDPWLVGGFSKETAAKQKNQTAQIFSASLNCCVTFFSAHSRGFHGAREKILTLSVGFPDHWQKFRCCLVNAGLRLCPRIW